MNDPLRNIVKIKSNHHQRYPSAPLVIDKAGNLYGTTETGGNFAKCGFGCGVVFKVSPDGSETVLHAFRGIISGEAPCSCANDERILKEL